ncbi:MAG: class I SAM-dependent methyltransferase [Acidobacteria bacterium]|nr:class I SAM-dependent methyltransferase [Acidobacteriota bacterium]MBI3656811.1 class I SAM-dependent methyltransferase [Acidobacteriota bacterium]
MASPLGEFYDNVYSKLCGRHPHLRPWHFQWLALKYVYRDLRRVLPKLTGRVLDVGCGGKPYEDWLPKATHHIGIDVVAGPKIDIVIAPQQSWPLRTAAFDVVLCSQVLEHVADLPLVLDEIYRVLKPGGELVITMPFAFNEHGSPEDYRRLSVHGIRALLAERYHIVEISPEGAIGSTVAALCLNWIEMNMNQFKATRWVKALALPLWIIFCSIVNGVGALFDSLDHTQAFYGNFLVVARKLCESRW